MREGLSNLVNQSKCSQQGFQASICLFHLPRLQMNNLDLKKNTYFVSMAFSRCNYIALYTLWFYISFPYIILTYIYMFIKSVAYIFYYFLVLLFSLTILIITVLYYLQGGFYWLVIEILFSNM